MNTKSKERVLGRWLIPIVVLALGLAMVATASAQSSAQSDRLAGANRFDTAIEISKHAFPDGSLEVYIANAELNPDALVGGALKDGPILLVPKCGDLPSNVAAEIERLAPFRVFALGGSAVVCDSMLQQAADAAPAPEDYPDQTVELSGEGDEVTPSFELNGGSYLVEWSFDAECSYSAWLEDDRGPVEQLANADGPASGETHVHGVDPGEYFVDMIADNSTGCPWSITLTSSD